jgi:hypothetical protein
MRRPTRFHPYSEPGTLDRRMWSFSTEPENVNPHVTSWPCQLMPPTSPSASLPAMPESLPRQVAVNRSPKPLKELALNTSMPPPNASAQPYSLMQRFASPLGCNQLDNLCTPFIPTQTKNNNSWATGVFKTWLSTRNSTQTVSARDVVPTDILEVHYPLQIVCLQRLSLRPDGLMAISIRVLL